MRYSGYHQFTNLSHDIYTNQQLVKLLPDYKSISDEKDWTTRMKEYEKWYKPYIDLERFVCKYIWNVVLLMCPYISMDDSSEVQDLLWK